MPSSFFSLPWCSYCYDPHIQDKRHIALPNFAPTVPEECSECAHKFVMGGPIWSDPIHDKEWASSILSSIHVMMDSYPAYAKISAILTSVSEVIPCLCIIHSASDRYEIMNVGRIDLVG